jgi:hypothetical protein
MEQAGAHLREPELYGQMRQSVEPKSFDELRAMGEERMLELFDRDQALVAYVLALLRAIPDED